MLYGHDIRYTKGDNANLENNYGVELFRAGNIAEAKAHFERSVALMDDWSVSQNNLGAVYEKEGDLEKAKAYYQRSADFLIIISRMKIWQAFFVKMKAG